MEAGDFVYIEYVGRIKDTKEIFDLTKEDIAKKENVFNPKFKYGPVPVIIDEKFVLPGLNDALKEMKVGEKKTVEIPPEKGFGQRNPQFVKLFQGSMFKEREQDPKPGAFVTINNAKGRIMSVDGGRVKVDFNHPLAGKTLEYELEIIRKIVEIDEKIKAVSYYFTGIEKDGLEVEIKKKTAEITIKSKANVFRETKETITKTITKWIPKVEKVKFIEIFEK